MMQSLVSKLNNLVRYLRTRRKAKLYQQWVEKADLPPEAVPEEFARDIVPKTGRERLRLRMLYILLGASLAVLFMGLILLIAHSC